MLKGVYVIAAILLASLFPCSAQFVDEIQVYEEECLGENTFHCLDGECITQGQYCNGVQDCKDGSDESFCPSAHIIMSQEQCNITHEYLCLDQKKCIPFTWICNNSTDCDDGSDESYCTMVPEPTDTTKCKGFSCDGGNKCISWLWVCDGPVDCDDQTDEYNASLCRRIMDFNRYLSYDGRNCDSLDALNRRQYKCKDQSYCLQGRRMCDGIQDCRDKSDEGDFCANWRNMCKNFTCGSPAKCREDPAGPFCECGNLLTTYNTANNSCVDLDECSEAQPKCSQRCINKDGRFSCSCDEGYTSDRYEYLCFASDPEPLLFFATRNDIRYYKLKSRQEVTVVTGVKEAHGVAYDGTFLYWVEKALGHQAIVRALLNDTLNTKQSLVALGVEDPGDIAIDWLGGHFYFTDAERGHIAVCLLDGAACTVLNTTARHPKFVTLYPQIGEMYWADWHDRPVIMRAKMDGSQAVTFLDNLRDKPTGLTIDIPNERLYFVDKHIHVVRLDGKARYVFLDDAVSHPYSLAVFENTVYWSDWATNTLQAAHKIHPPTQKRRVVLSVDTPVFGIHVYHPVLMRPTGSGCHNHDCSDMCLLNGNGTRACACFERRRLRDNTTCVHGSFNELPQFLVVGGGQYFTSIRYNSLGNPESRATVFDIGRVQAMAYNNFKRILYVYDGQRKTINYIDMNDFRQGVTKLLEYRGLDNVVDMDYDYVSDALYFVDAGRRFIEVISLKNKVRAIVHRFQQHEIPVSMCVVPEYGRMLVAVIEHEQHNEIHIDSFGLDGAERHHLMTTGLKGPHISLRYSHNLDRVFISDEGNGIIDYIPPTGTHREQYRRLSTTVTSLAVTDTTVFWTDRRTPRLFWSGIHETGQKIRRIELGQFPNNSQLHLQSTSPLPDLSSPLMQHPCFRLPPCSHVCVQVAHPTPLQVPMQYYMGYKCLCPAGLLLIGDKCERLAGCSREELYCHHNNSCVKGKRCDGHRDCPGGEDESHCEVTTEPPADVICASHQKMCNGVCVSKNVLCKDNATEKNISAKPACSAGEFQCANDSSICVQRWQQCDAQNDCPDASDENNCELFSCMDTEFMCASGSCMLLSWRCDGDADCADASDEADCENKTCSQGFYQCQNLECIEIRKRCDGRHDCLDLSDEDGCDDEVIPETEQEEAKCGDNEYMCFTNRSICLPLTARCNTKLDCPDGSDESDCEYLCSASVGLFRCEQEDYCIPRRLLCDGINHCRDGSDEAHWNCRGNRTKKPTTVPVYPPAQCDNGFQCGTGQCIEWAEVCDQTPNCFDGSDEGGNCFTACDNHTCNFVCQRTPLGGLCLCPSGHKMDYTINQCVDIDECANEICTQKCHNVPGSFFCSCYHGYALRSNRRTCKATKGAMSVLFVSGNSVRSISADGFVTPVFNDPNIASITDMDFNVRKNKLYVTSKDVGQLVEVNITRNNMVVTNIGHPSKVAVDWITGNTYFVDTTGSSPRIRVCNVLRRRCAMLQKLPADAEVTAFIVDPANNRMFYCLTHALESIVWSSSLSGHQAKDLATVQKCTGLAVDSFKEKLYVAETGPPHIIQMDYEGHTLMKLNDANLEAPHHLAIFEDHVYFLVANSFKLSRCALYEQRICEPYIYKVFDANTFVLRHESVQRDDVENTCADYTCDNVCVLSDEGALCVCDDGKLSVDGNDCKPLLQSEMPLFNGWTATDMERVHRVSITLMIIAIVVVALFLALFLGYHFGYKPRRDGVRPMAVRFQNVSPFSEGTATEDPTIDLPTSDRHHEFVNPLEYMRNVWRHSFKRRQHPIGTAGLSIDVPPPPEDVSDTESDLDTKDTRKFF